MWVERCKQRMKEHFDFVLEFQSLTLILSPPELVRLYVYFGSRHWPCVTICSMTVLSSARAHGVSVAEDKRWTKIKMTTISLRYSVSCCGWDCGLAPRGTLKYTCFRPDHWEIWQCLITSLPPTVSSLFSCGTPSVTSSFHLPLCPIEKHIQIHTMCSIKSVNSVLTIRKLGK